MRPPPRLSWAYRYGSIEPFIGSGDPTWAAACSEVLPRTLPCVQMAGKPARELPETARRQRCGAERAEPASSVHPS